jgi:hypothetical protein
LEIKVKLKLFLFVSLIILFSIIVVPVLVEASEGLPGSAKFGYGARIDLDGEYLDKVINTASYVGLDWVAIDFDWEEMWSDPSSPPKISVLTELINYAQQSDISVLLTIKNPAQWAVTENGPDPQTTANLVLSLVDFYSGKVLAIELFPGANTQEGWKAKPNPGNYLETLKRTQDTLTAAGKNTTIITTISPDASTPSANDISDLEFLSNLYSIGGKPHLTIVGIQFNKITGDPFSNPGPHYLRHYEEIRKIMLKNDHKHGTIWITGFSVPGSDNFNPDQTYLSPGTTEEQSNWIEEAYKLLRAQLYIGTAFYDQINPHIDPQDTTQVTIIDRNSNLHPSADRLIQLIDGLTPNAQLMDSNSSGQNQENSLNGNNNTFLTILQKKYVRQIDYKHP